MAIDAFHAPIFCNHIPCRQITPFAAFYHARPRHAFIVKRNQNCDAPVGGEAKSGSIEIDDADRWHWSAGRAVIGGTENELNCGLT